MYGQQCPQLFMFVIVRKDNCFVWSISINNPGDIGGTAPCACVPVCVYVCVCVWTPYTRPEAILLEQHSILLAEVNYHLELNEAIQLLAIN